MRIRASHRNQPGQRVGGDDRQPNVIVADGKDPEIDGGVDDTDQPKAGGLERYGALMPGHSETIEDILEGRRDHCWISLSTAKLEPVGWARQRLPGAV